ncbi:hypothetical protein [Rubinisphaera italica]|uniref:Lipoprotein n=1 Tax=Rubinisphaera italica TaxID=2527969 RepID=A0A5C5XHB7_9PLAN|nr:hypothetical protein [Rubinisphaera italica]TWT61525.1 hypothetical protein Pan54_22610 [Rubinisphaera italica]
MKMVSSAIAVITLISLSGCGSETAVWTESAAAIDCAIEVQIAVRSQPYRQGDGINDGDFLVVSSNVFPIQSTGGPSHVVCNNDGVIIEMQWDDVRLLQTRIDQHQSPETRLSFDNFRCVIMNKLVVGSTSHGMVSGPNSRNLNTEFDWLFSPLTFSSGVEKNERTLVIRARLLPQIESAKPLTIPQMPDTATENAG